MKLKPIILLFFALLIALPLKAGDDDDLNAFYLYAGRAANSKSLALRAGFFQGLIGGELYYKTDAKRTYLEMPQLDGLTYRFSVMGGFTYRVFTIFLLTAHAGYGAVGSYCVEATNSYYGVQDLRQGVEVGASITLCLYWLSFFVGYSTIPSFSDFNNSFREVTFGLGLTLWKED